MPRRVVAMGDAAAAPGPGKLEKSYFDVLGICCPSEVPLVEKLLEPLAGVHRVSVVVPSRTVIVVHDASVISQAQIGKDEIATAVFLLLSAPNPRHLLLCFLVSS